MSAFILITLLEFPKYIMCFICFGFFWKLGLFGKVEIVAKKVMPTKNTLRMLFACILQLKQKCVTIVGHYKAAPLLFSALCELLAPSGHKFHLNSFLVSLAFISLEPWGCPEAFPILPTSQRPSNFPVPPYTHDPWSTTLRRKPTPRGWTPLVAPTWKKGVQKWNIMMTVKCMCAKLKLRMAK